MSQSIKREYDAMNAPLPDIDTLPLDAIDVSEATLYQQDIWRPYFARLRAEDPVHWSIWAI